MKITETFVADILKAEYLMDYQKIYDKSPMLQYLDKKMKAVHGNSKTRRSLANIYAIYSILSYSFIKRISITKKKHIANLMDMIICDFSISIAVSMAGVNYRITH